MTCGRPSFATMGTPCHSERRLTAPVRSRVAACSRRPWLPSAAAASRVVCAAASAAAGGSEDEVRSRVDSVRLARCAVSSA